MDSNIEALIAEVRSDMSKFSDANLIDENDVTEYEVHQSPIRSAIFDSGRTSRINVGHFMADLITDDNTWNKWKGQMPVIYNMPSS